MGFPVGCSELVFPRVFLQILWVLGLIRKVISMVFCYLGLQDFLEADIGWPEQSSSTRKMPEFESVSAVLMREILPVLKFREVEVEAPPESCAVCLYEFDGEDEIRRLTNCTHIFHRSCLDRWMGYDQTTCPLCRTPFIPYHMQAAFNERLWEASGIPDFYQHNSDSISNFASHNHFSP